MIPSFVPVEKPEPSGEFSSLISLWSSVLKMLPSPLYSYHSTQLVAANLMGVARSSEVSNWSPQLQVIHYPSTFLITVTANAIKYKSNLFHGSLS